MRDTVYQLLNDIAQERTRQEEAEGFTLEQEDAHDFGELARAAAAYALAAAAWSIPLGSPMRAICHGRAKRIWPVTVVGDPVILCAREGYIRAIALLMAEIQRIDRRDGRQTPLDRTDAQSRRFERKRVATDSPAAQPSDRSGTNGFGGPAPAGEPAKETPNA